MQFSSTYNITQNKKKKKAILKNFAINLKNF